MVVPWTSSSDLEAFRRTESSRLSCVSPGTLFVLKYCSLTRCEGRFPGTFRTFCITHLGWAPSYLSELLETYRPPRYLRSSSKHLSSWQLRKLTLWTMVTELFPFVHQNSGTIFYFTLDRPNPKQVLNLNLKLTYLKIVSLIILNLHF